MLNVLKNILKKFGKYDNENKLSNDRGNLIICLKCFSSI